MGVTKKGYIRWMIFGAALLLLPITFYGFAGTMWFASLRDAYFPLYVHRVRLWFAGLCIDFAVIVIAGGWGIWRPLIRWLRRVV